MKKCFILIENDAPLSSISLAEDIVHQGYECILVLDSNLEVPDNKTYPFVLKQITDFSKKEIQRIIYEIREKYDLAGITSVFSFFVEDGLLPAIVSDIAKDFGLRHLPSNAFIQSNNKYLMHRCLKKNGVFTTRFSIADSINSLIKSCEHVKFPVILKPISGVASSFIYKCNDLSAAINAFTHYLENVDKGLYSYLSLPHSFQELHFYPTKQLLVEEYLDGPELSVELLCTNSEILPLLVHDKLDVEEGKYCSFENLLITPPVRINEKLVEESKKYAVDIAKALGLKNCFCHVELRIHQGRPAVMEINPRIGGMRVKETIKNRLGIDHNHILIQLLSGKNLNLPDTTKNYKDYLGMCAIYTKKSGILSNVSGLNKAKEIRGLNEVSQHIPIGSKVGGNFEETFVITAWFEGDSEKEIRNIDKQIKKLITLEVEPA